MRQRSAVILFALLILGLFSVLNSPFPVNAQIPTVDMATVTGTALGPYIVVKQDAEQRQINVRSGPGTFYDKVGVLLTGQQVPAIGRSVGGEWVYIEYPGVPGSAAWVYSPLVEVLGGTLPIVEPPPTPTPLVTPTIDPTLAAEFIVTNAPTRLPTYTEPAPLAIPTFTAVEEDQGIAGMPVGMIILVAAGLGILLGFIALAQGR
ncbi:MAG: SH3 domain-containing protein [Anaerolineaceae bacterium]|jgi:uncharacterized protein YraI|nr:SH3 domain-containing protein [Anaerolineaceae bacterium]